MPRKVGNMSNQITVRPSVPLSRSLRAATLELSTQQEVGQALDQLLGSYPQGKATNPEIYVAAVTAVLAEYPASVIAAVTHPVTGFARRQKFLPTIAELTEVLDGELAREIRESQPPQKTEDRPEITPEERARVAKRFAELSSSLANSADPKLGKKRKTA